MDLGVETVLTSMGINGAVFTNGRESYFCRSTSVPVNSTVGAGDSMVAATCVALERGVDNAELLKMAVAAGTSSVISGGTNLFFKDKYVDVYSKLFVEKK